MEPLQKKQTESTPAALDIETGRARSEEGTKADLSVTPKKKSHSQEFPSKEEDEELVENRFPSKDEKSAAV